MQEKAESNVENDSGEAAALGQRPLIDSVKDISDSTRPQPESTSKTSNGLGADSSEIVSGSIVLKGVSKSFTRRVSRAQGYRTIKGTFFSREAWSSRKLSEFTALNNLNLNISPGDSLGIIGRNGSGKSTLLKIISGIYKADRGTVKVKGRVSALIELGAGFHPDFSGRENIYLGGVMYGLTRKEIDRRFHDIVEYAELEDYIDDPVRTYSSGMFMRLGFSLAVFTDPDILLIDEVLAVGDAAFVHRCHETISDFKRRGKTLVFVTHDLSAVERWCDEALWLHQGNLVRRGEPRWVIDSYLQGIEDEENERLRLDNKSEGELAGGKQQSESSAPENLAPHQDEPLQNDIDFLNALQGAEQQNENLEGTESADSQESAEVTRWGNRDVEILTVRMLGDDGSEKWVFHDHDTVEVEVEYQIHKPVSDLVFGVGIIRADGLSVFGSNTAIEALEIPGKSVLDTAESAYSEQKGRYRFTIQRLGLNADSYFLDVAAHRSDGLPYDYHHRLYRFSVRTQSAFHGVYAPQHSWSFDLTYV